LTNTVKVTTTKLKYKAKTVVTGSRARSVQLGKKNRGDSLRQEDPKREVKTFGAKGRNRIADDRVSKNPSTSRTIEGWKDF